MLAATNKNVKSYCPLRPYSVPFSFHTPPSYMYGYLLAELQRILFTFQYLL